MKVKASQEKRRDRRTKPKGCGAVTVEARSPEDVSAAIARTMTRPSVTAAETIDAFKGLGERGCDINALVAELADVLDWISYPDAITLMRLIKRAESSFARA